MTPRPWQDESLVEGTIRLLGLIDVVRLLSLVPAARFALGLLLAADAVLAGPAIWRATCCLRPAESCSWPPCSVPPQFLTPLAVRRAHGVEGAAG
jgi:hypothetical protein